MKQTKYCYMQQKEYHKYNVRSQTKIPRTGFHYLKSKNTQNNLNCQESGYRLYLSGVLRTGSGNF